MTLTHLSLFSGIVGIDLSSEWAGFETVGQCEMAEYPYKVLCKHWPNVPKWRDVRDVTKESFRERTRMDTVDLISGGFPCQPYSLSGDRKGSDDDRALWPEMLRVIKEIRPSWVLGENVAGFIDMDLDKAINDLESIEYTVRPFVFPALAVNAPHRRDRIFIIGSLSNSGCVRHQGDERLRKNGESFAKRRTSFSWSTSKLFDDIDWAQRACESAFLRGSNGIPHRLDRIKALGNAVSPKQVYPILKAIADIENNS